MSTGNINLSTFLSEWGGQVKNLINNDNEPPQPQQPEYIDTTNNYLFTLNGTNRAKVSDVSSIILQTAKSMSPPAGYVVESYWCIPYKNIISSPTTRAYAGSTIPEYDGMPICILQVILPDDSVGILDLTGYAVNVDGEVDLTDNGIVFDTIDKDTVNVFLGGDLQLLDFVVRLCVLY